MALTCTPRKVTAAEQALMRHDGQWCELFAAIDPAPPVYTAKLDPIGYPLDSNDEIAEIDITTGTFAVSYTIALAGMTIRVGSAAGLTDLGYARLRSDVTATGSTTIEIGETSEIEWLDYTAGAAGIGTLAINGTVNVVGSSTVFTTQLAVGKKILVAGEERVVATITDNTHLTVTQAFTQTLSGQTFIYYNRLDRYLTIVDEFLIWPRLLRTIGPIDTASLPGYVQLVSGSTTVLGAEVGTYPYATTINVSNGTTTVTRQGAGTAFTLTFVAGDHIKAVWQVGINFYTEYRKVISVTDADHLIVDSAFTIYAVSFGNAYPIRTRFLRDLHPGDNLKVGSEPSHLIISITDDMTLNVHTPWEINEGAAVYSATLLAIYMDYDIPVSDPDYSSVNQQHISPIPPVPILGGPIVIDNFQSNSVAVQLDASGSYQIDGSIASYLWSKTGGTLSSTSIANPTLTISAAETYRVTCRVSGAAGRPAYGHRKIYVFDKTTRPLTIAKIDNCSGSVDSGGWSCHLTVYGDAGTEQIRDQAQIVLFARDHYGTTQQAIGQVSRSANIVMIGWIVGETIEIDPELGTVTFEVQGPQFWLDRITDVVTAMEDVLVAPALWVQMYHLTVDRALWNFFVWRTTLTLTCDLHLTGDTRRLKFLEGKLGSLASQVDQFTKQVILARAVADRLGRMVVEIDPQLIPAASRTTPVAQHFEVVDLRAPINIQRRRINEVSRMTVSGVSWDGTTTATYVATQPGKVFKTHGRLDSITNLAIDNQTQADRLALLALANANNPYPSVPVPLASINRLIDIAPAMYITIDASDNLRGLALDRLPVLPKRISHSYDPETGTFLTDIEGEGYTDEDTRIEGAPPDLPFSFD